MATIKVQPWGEGQGDFVFIDEETFDKNFHKLYEDKKEKQKRTPKKEEVE
jgi:hypothetical protein